MRRRALLAFCAAPALARAQSFPDRPIRMVVPLPPGGATDIWARLIAEPMGAMLGQPVVIENRAGAGGMIGAEAVKNAAPDGHTILFHISNHVQTPVVLKRFPYHPINDFSFIGKFGTTALPWCVRAELPPRNMAEFRAYARGKGLNYGTYSPGSSGHAFAQVISDHDRLDMTAVHYRGEAPMLADVLGGRIPCAFHSMTGSGDHIRAGRIRPLAALGPVRIPSLPELPTLVEQGYPRDVFGRSGFVGLFAPKGLPAAANARLVAAFRHAMEQPATLNRMRELDTIPDYLGPEEFKRDVEDYFAFWMALVERTGITAEG
jgi:tripartite-type tricarboxylate transporter receptor subunit TctC